MKILALDTSSDACSVALMWAGKSLERYQLVPRQHTHLILPMVQAVLAEAQCSLQHLDAIAFGNGPGSFTGLRIATSVAQGLAYGAGLPIVPIGTLLAMAYGAYHEFGYRQVAVALDARMEQIYFAAYQFQNAACQVMMAETLTAPTAVMLPVEMTQGWGIGSAWQIYAHDLSLVTKRLRGVVPDYYPRAKYIAELAATAYQQGQALSPEQALPNYLQNELFKKG